MAGDIFDGRRNRLSALIGSQVLAWLIGINIAVSLVVWLVGAGGFRLDAWLGLPGSWSGFLQRPWGLLTYMFTQADVLHMLFNVLTLYWFGRVTLWLITERQLLFIYVGGGLAGGVAFLIWNAVSPSGLLLLGASASVMALIVTVSFYQPRFEVNLFLIGRVKLVLIGLIFIGLTLLGIGGGNGGGQAAHIGGIVFGLFTALALRKGADPTKFLSGINERINTLQAERRERKAASRRRADEALLTGIRGRLADRERLDELLDKIRASGYSSLSRSERAELNALSNRLDSRD